MTLRIVCCFTDAARDGVRPETYEALMEYADRRAALLWGKLHASDERAYGDALAKHWADALAYGDALAIVEPDIVVRPDVIDAFLRDPADYVCFPYAWKTDVGPALGCTRFSAAFIARYPTLIDEAQATGVTWRQLDVVIMRQLLARKYGEQPKVLLPPVEHLNEAKALLPDASPEPLMTVPHW